jgi:DNA topoisomerase-1
MILIIVESPAKCKKIEGFLGNSYKCIASFGHFREFTNGLKSIDFNNNYKTDYKVSHDKKKYVNIMRAAIKKASEVILATDDDREGEAIAWHICKLFNLPIATTKRIIFHEITKKAILQAVNNPITLNMDEVNAQQARQILDLIVGFTVSPVLWKYISRNTEKGLSAGRCQTPALKLVYENDLECKKAKGETVYETKGTFTHMNILYKLNKSFVEKETVIDFLEKSKDFKYELRVGEKKRVKKSPPKPFTTSTLQQKASNTYNFSPKTTMRLAQTLYENGYITYMRTDNAKYSLDFIESAASYIQQKWNSKYIGNKLDKISLQKGDNEKKEKGDKEKKEKGDNEKKEKGDKEDKKENLAQEAHEAIRPTDILKEMVQNPKIGNMEKKLYTLIWANSLESCMASSIYDVMASYIDAPDSLKDKHIKYNNNCEKNVFPGWEIVKGVNEDDDIFEFINSLQESKKVGYREIKSEITIKKLKTHYTEARLVQLLEKKGIGRPSTFSSLVSKIMDRFYVKKVNIVGKKIDCENFILKEEIKEEHVKKSFGDEKNKLVIEPVGIIVIEFLNKYFDNLFNYDYTKKMEGNLDKISAGEYKLKKLCDDCRKEIDLSIKNISKKEGSPKRDSKMKKGIKIDDKHRWIIGKYGPVILCEEGENISFKKVKPGIDIEKLKKGGYKIEEIIMTCESNAKTLGQIDGEEIVIKNGKFGLYFSFKGKNKSLKYLNKQIQDITLEDINKVIEKNVGNKTSILKEISNVATVRQGKFGPYVFYKTETMKKPKFISIKKKAWKDIDMQWVLDNV